MIDYYTLPDLGAIYGSADSQVEILTHGVPLLAPLVLMPESREFLERLIELHGTGRVLDALVVCLIEKPFDPARRLGALSCDVADEIPKDWKPAPRTLAELEGLGISDDAIQVARDVFVMWFREQGVRHSNFASLFTRWCKRDWELADHSKPVFLRRIRASAGDGEEFMEPA